MSLWSNVVVGADLIIINQVSIPVITDRFDGHDSIQNVLVISQQLWPQVRGLLWRGWGG
jgi:hypothetical protein